MAQIARRRTSFHAKSRVGFADRVVAPLANLMAMSWSKRLACLGGAAIVFVSVVSLAGHVFNGWSPSLWGSKRLPTSAAERAPLFAEAWASHDAAAMRRLVLPADEAKLNAWVAATPVPAPVSAIPASDRVAKTVSVQKDDMDGAILKVKISGRSTVANDPKNGDGFVQRESWCYSGGNWYFSPESPPADATERKAGPPAASSTGGFVANARPAPTDPEVAESPTRAAVSRNVVIPTTVPPWARVR